MSYTSPSLPAGLWSLIGLLMLALPPAPAVAQAPDDSLRTEALKDFHGPDMTGKDGPLAKAGLDLLVLYHEYRASQQRGDDTFSSRVAGVDVTDGYVTIDAIAMTEAERLRADLKELGFTSAAIAGRVVSGRLPIRKIPAMAKLESLRGVVLSRAKTYGDAARPTEKPSTALDDRPTEPPDDTASTDDQQGAPPSEKDANTGTLLVLLGILGLLLLTEL